jgi:hypothetical protein
MVIECLAAQGRRAACQVSKRQDVIVRGMFGDNAMAKSQRKYSPKASHDVELEMRRYKRGTARSGKAGGKAGGKVKSRRQAIAIGLSIARKKGEKVPRKKK